jgi:hypothetical protein
MVAKPFDGYAGRYLRVRKSDSAKGLSSETRGTAEGRHDAKAL